ncbi:MAG: dTDP-4-dehydrorhamnose 3,5-epimerase [Solirubrobacteraceae bacterium]|nr:dTDP-4-dehydrorhamnose 3,5-epimerase [Solirubrobacteraceae bacterium]
MERLPTRLDGPMLLAPPVHGDARGFLVESYRASTLRKLGVADDFVQDNHSRSAYGVVRGMHFQVDPPAAKLVRCARGAVTDVVVDVRPGSSTYGEWEAFELTDENQRVLYVPVGFAHGFAVLSEVADVLYKQSAEWTPAADRGIALDDPDIGIEWPVPPDDRIISERDRRAPRLADIEAQLAPG